MSHDASRRRKTLAALGLCTLVAAPLLAPPEASPAPSPSTRAEWSARPDLPPGPQLRCDECHGVPPASGAHRAHADPDGYQLGFDCNACHYVERFPELHDDGRVHVRIRPGLLESGGPGFEAGTCAGVYCHSDGRGEARPVRWSEEAALGCDGCHADRTSAEIDMSGRHEFHVNSGVACASCHAGVVDVAGAIVGHRDHVDGDVDLGILAGSYDSATATCTSGCHEDRVWDEDD